LLLVQWHRHWLQVTLSLMVMTALRLRHRHCDQGIDAAAAAVALSLAARHFVTEGDDCTASATDIATKALMLLQWHYHWLQFTLSCKQSPCPKSAS